MWSFFKREDVKNAKNAEKDVKDAGKSIKNGFVVFTRIYVQPRR